MKENLDQLVENYFTPKEEKLDTDVLLGLIAEALTSTTPPTKENIQEESQSSAGEIKDILEDDPRYQKKT